MSELPQNWVWTKMLDMLDYEGGSQPPKKEFVYEPRSGYVRLLQIRDFGDKPFPTYVPDSHRLKKTTRDDLLLARYGGSSASDSLGRICTGLEGAYNVALAKLVFCRDLLDPNYVKYLFMGPWFKEKVGQNSRSCQTGFNRDDVVDIEFPLPPLNEQRRITAKLEKLLSCVDAAQARLASIPHIVKRFRQSVLAAACSGRLTADWREMNQDVKSLPLLSKAADTNGDHELPDSWVIVHVGEIIDGLKYGTSQKCSYEKLGVPVLRIPNIGEGVIETTDLKYAQLPQKEFEQLKLSAGDILLIRSNGSVSLVGKSALVRESERAFAYAGYLIRLKPNRSYVEPEFLNLALSSHGVRLQVEIPARSTSGVNNINSEEVKALEMALPLLAEQQEIVRRVEALFKTADALEARYRMAKAHVDKLTQSILAKAFRGELVPQDPNDEPASVLLERIRQERNGAPIKKAKATRKKPQK